MQASGEAAERYGCREELEYAKKTLEGGVEFGLLDSGWHQSHGEGEVIVRSSCGRGWLDENDELGKKRRLEGKKNLTRYARANLRELAQSQ